MKTGIAWKRFAIPFSVAHVSRAAGGKVADGAGRVGRVHGCTRYSEDGRIAFTIGAIFHVRIGEPIRTQIQIR